MFCEKEDATKAAKKKNDDLEKANRPEIDDLEDKSVVLEKLRIWNK